jgi:hypothetical protein
MSEDPPRSNSPATQSALPESSMEDIVASISRIIAEDNRTNRPVPAAGGTSSPILELTEVIEADGSVRKLPGAGPTRAELPEEPAPEPVMPPVEPPTPGAQAGDAEKPDHQGSAILSAAAAEAAAAAFARLGEMPRRHRGEPELPLGHGGRTLEEIVRDALRPLLQAWLDDHLPALVERLVREEIERVVHDARLR